MQTKGDVVLWMMFHGGYLGGTFTRKNLRDDKQTNSPKECFSPRKSTVFADGNRGWASHSAELGLRFHSVTHQVKQFTKNVPASQHASSVAGTQTMDRCWKSLKTWMGVGYSVSNKKVGDRFMSESIPSLVYQWMWRQTVLPCAPTKFMQELVRLLKQ